MIRPRNDIAKGSPGFLGEDIHCDFCGDLIENGDGKKGGHSFYFVENEQIHAHNDCNKHKKERPQEKAAPKTRTFVVVDLDAGLN
jgi:ribosomal protein L24E